jgi:hypothetical protein
MHRAWIAKGTIILFCLWHMVAVAAFSIDRTWSIAPLTTFKDIVDPVTRGYILMTSQWQQWNLFSPDPLRRISQYRIEMAVGDGWKPILSIDGSLPYSQRAGLTKTLRRLEDRSEGDPIVRRFLEVICTRERIVEGIEVRLQRKYTVLPRPERPLSIADWRSYEPTWFETTLGTTSCPALPS